MYYYRLNPEIYLFSGNGNSILCNVLSGDIIALDKEVSDKISRAEGNIPSKGHKIFDNLIDLGWMQRFENKVFIDKIRFTNAFNKKRSWRNIPPIENVIIQLTNDCDMSCETQSCEKAFCPMCITTSTKKTDLSFNDWKRIIDEIQLIRPTNYILTGGNPVNYSDFDRVYSYIKKTGANVFIHLNNADNINRFTDNDLIMFSVLSDKQRDKIKQYRENQNVVVFDNSPLNTKTNSTYNVSLDHPVINKNSFNVKFSFGRIFTRMLYDDCLVGKLTILNNGDIVPCLGMRDNVIGNLVTDKFVDVIKKNYEDYWSISVTDRTDHICVGCCYRYNCYTCQKFDKSYCNYEVEVGKWT